jgi:RNA polymerase sigma factor (TIGR02999 family)
MSDVTRLIDGAAAGDPRAAAELLPLVYDELRRLAAERLANEKSGQTLQPTALVHEAYLRLVASPGRASPGREPGEVQFNGRGHFFAAAAEAMRRILVESARRKGRHKHGGGRERIDLDQIDPARDEAAERLLAIDEALDRLAAEDPAAAAVVKLRFFAGLTVEESAAALGVSTRTVNRHWEFARAWLFEQLGGRGD